jgi:outer membrane protein assembly factor BamB
MRIAVRVALVAVVLSSSTLRADDWPQWGGPQRDNVWRETGLVESLPEKMEPKWRAPMSNGYAGPAVAGGKVYVTDRTLGDGAENPSNPFARSAVEGKERVFCLDEKTGKELWKHEYPSTYTVSYPNGPRATPAVDGDRVYTLGTMGDFLCLNVSDGKVKWSKNFLKEFGGTLNTWGFSSAPLIDGDNVITIAGGKNGSCVVAFNKMTGDVKWKALDAKDFGYCPPIIIEDGGVRQLIIWTPEAVSSLNPATGAVYWQEKWQIKAGLAVPTPIHDKERHALFLTAFYDGPIMFDLDPNKPAAKVRWRGESQSEIKTDKLHSIMPTPHFWKGHIYGVCSYGQLRCLEQESGKRVWETLKATGRGRWWNAFLVRNEDRFFLANEQGDLILANLTPKGYEELGRFRMLEATTPLERSRKVVWSHPAFANRCVYARNDKEIVCYDLSKK